MADILTKRSEDYAQWYNDLVLKADLAQTSDVRGCMVIKPHGYAIWEHMQRALDDMFKETGHVNAYFPVFIPISYLAKEADHVEGFAKECAVVTHHRLKNDPEKGIVVDPEAKLNEELIVRPTSETIIWNTYKGWINSYRDLPILVNQWANVVRWEMRTRLFLRTTEFLWQEGHTAHATKEEAVEEAQTMLGVYTRFAEEWLAMPVIQGVKTESERFAGAEDTYCIEALMQDGKALQAGTSHFLGQNFAKAFDVQFTDQNNKLAHVWATSWGVTTRMIGAMIMVHSDDQGLVIPPKLAPTQVVIVPIYKTKEQLDALQSYIEPLIADLKAKHIRVKFDGDDKRKPGWKFAQYEFQGYPLRIAVGNRDMENGNIELARRDELSKEVRALAGAADHIETLLEEIQNNLYQRALQFRDEHITEVDTYEAFKTTLEEKGGFISAHWDGTAETEKKVKEETKATIRCIPLQGEANAGTCMVTGAPSAQRVLFAKAY